MENFSYFLYFLTVCLHTSGKRARSEQDFVGSLAVVFSCLASREQLQYFLFDRKNSAEKVPIKQNIADDVTKSYRPFEFSYLFVLYKRVILVYLENLFQEQVFPIIYFFDCRSLSQQQQSFSQFLHFGGALRVNFPIGIAKFSILISTNLQAKSPFLSRSIND